MVPKEYDFNQFLPLNHTQWPFVKLKYRTPHLVLDEACEVFDKLNLNYWIGFGVALGFHRQNDFIPYDTDIDMCIKLDFNNLRGCKDLLTTLWDELALKGYRLIRVAHYGEEERYPMQIAAINKHKVPLDIFFFYENIEEDSLVHFTDIGIIRCKKEHIDGIQKRKFKYGSYPIPMPTEDYLEHYYGSGWNTPTGKKELYWPDDGKGTAIELKDTPWRKENNEWFKRFCEAKDVTERKNITK